MRLGLLSTARINALLVAGARRTHGIEVVAIGSRDRARAQAQARALEIPRVHDSYEALLADPDVEAVYIALPNSLHVEWSLRALQAGRHVLCEKPLSRHPGELARAYQEAEQRGLILLEAFMWRHHPQVDTLLEQMPTIGELRLIRASFSFALERSDDIRLRSGLDGGALMDVGCYCVSAARLLAGEPLAVAAQRVLGGDGVDVRLTALLRFPADVLATVDCGLDIAAREGLEVTGTRGVLTLNDPWRGRNAEVMLRRDDGSLESIAVEQGDAYACELEDFAAAVTGARPPRFGREDALGQARTLAALYASAERNQTMEVER